MPPQGSFYWPGIETFISGQFTFTHGVEPSLAVVYIAPQQAFLPAVGTLSVFFEGSIEFPDCLLDYISIERDSSGKIVWGLHVKDRRVWWLECGWVSGYYNYRLGESGSTIVPETEMQPQELAELCFEAMGEGAFDISALPNLDFPATEWDAKVAAQALLDIVDPAGCRVVLRFDNSVVLAKTGEGAELPMGQYVAGSISFDPPNYPSSIRAFGAKTVVQYDFPLRAMALEKDGSVVPLDEVSYAPTDGWESVGDPIWFSDIVDEDDRALAVKSVYKYYGIDPEAGIAFPGVDPDNPAGEFINSDFDVQRIILLDEQLTKTPETADDPDKALPAWIYGVYYNAKSIAGNSTDFVDGSIDEADVSKGYFDGHFTLDKDRHLVIFEDSVYQFDDADATIAPAELRLRTSCQVRSSQNFAPLRYSRTADTPGAQLATEEKAIVRDDIGLEIIYSESGSDDNLTEINDALTYYLAGELQKYQLLDPATFTYPGLRFDIQPDGAVQQIQWIVDGEGKATTVISRNREDLTVAQSYSAQKQKAQIKAALAKVKQQSSFSSAQGGSRSF